MDIRRKRVAYIMICSTSEVAFEREKAFKIIHDWNRANLNKDLVLVPIGFEDVWPNAVTKDAQEQINERLLTISDAAVVIFWTKLGRKDDKGIAYTIGEANAHITKHCPTMFFFSKEKIDPDEIDINAYQELKEFKKNPEKLLRDETTGETRNIFYVDYPKQADFSEVFRNNLYKMIDDTFQPQICINRSNAAMPIKKLKDQGKKAPAETATTIERELYIEFGRYPQNHVILPDDEHSLSCIASNSDGSIYRDNSTGEEYFLMKEIHRSKNAWRYHFSDGSKIDKSIHHYFKFSPIKWRILAQDADRTLLLSDFILDWRHFLEEGLIDTQAEMVFSTVDGCPPDTKANNWEWSTLRKWLDDTFINTAFSVDEQEYILSTQVSNGIEMGCISEENEYKRLSCNPTVNKVFILSYADMVNPAYGFNSDPFYKDPERIAQLTDYAIARGVEPKRHPFIKEALTGWTWLRSPADYHMYLRYDGHKLIDERVYSDEEVADALYAAQARVCDVMADGHVCCRGSLVDGSFKAKENEPCDGTANGVRVAIVVKNTLPGLHDL